MSFKNAFKKIFFYIQKNYNVAFHNVSLYFSGYLKLSSVAFVKKCYFLILNFVHLRFKETRRTGSTPTGHLNYRTTAEANDGTLFVSHGFQDFLFYWRLLFLRCLR